MAAFMAGSVRAQLRVVETVSRQRHGFAN